MLRLGKPNPAPRLHVDDCFEFHSHWELRELLSTNHLNYQHTTPPVRLLHGNLAISSSRRHDTTRHKRSLSQSEIAVPTQHSQIQQQLHNLSISTFIPKSLRHKPLNHDHLEGFIVPLANKASTMAKSLVSRRLRCGLGHSCHKSKPKLLKPFSWKSLRISHKPSFKSPSIRWWISATQIQWFRLSENILTN